MKEKFCILCGRKENQVKALYEQQHGCICNECQLLRESMFGSGNLDVEDRQRDSALFDEYQRFRLEEANRHSLKSQFNSLVDPPKDPAEKERLRSLLGDEMGQEMPVHPILGKSVEFNGVNEDLILPSLDPEQQDKYLEHQLQLQKEQRLEKLNEQTMKPGSPGA